MYAAERSDERARQGLARARARARAREVRGRRGR